MTLRVINEKRVAFCSKNEQNMIYLISIYLENKEENKEENWYEIPIGVTGCFVNPISGSVTDLSTKDLLYFIKGTEPSYEKEVFDNLFIKENNS